MLSQSIQQNDVDFQWNAGTVTFQLKCMHANLHKSYTACRLLFTLDECVNKFDSTKARVCRLFPRIKDKTFTNYYQFHLEIDRM